MVEANSTIEFCSQTQSPLNEPMSLPSHEALPLLLVSAPPHSQTAALRELATLLMINKAINTVFH